jgi:predicted RNA methylase
MATKTENHTGKKMKLTKAQTKVMTEVNKLVALDRRLTEDERLFVLENFQEGATHDSGAMGAFFTPWGLARDFSIEVPSGCGSIVDLCAGIGSLAYACEGKAKSTICVERCAEYVRVGRKVMPDATWIHADVFDGWWKAFEPFDAAISNPPFGRIKADVYEGRYKGAEFEYKVIELASRIARWGTFIVPQMSAPFRYSGNRDYQESIADKCRKFMDQTAIALDANCGIDTETYRGDWHGVSPVCEVVVCDFESVAEELPDCPAAQSVAMVQPVNQLDLFAMAA